MKPQWTQLMTADRHRLRRLWQRCQALPSEDSRRQHFETQYRQSQQRYQQRLHALPTPRLQEDLPVYAQREALLQALRTHQVLIVCGETGSGKTTQLPQLCLQLGWGAAGWIAHTQPRRIAARSVASRLAEALQVPLGGAVGYQVRFDEQLSPQTCIKLMTDGMLLAEIQRDPYLSRYEVLIIDEAHERSLNIDFLLGYVKRLLKKRRDLKIIITSATIDAAQFSKHFDDAPVIQVSGRSYPVQIEYQPPLENEDVPEQVLRAIEALDAHQKGDILVFLATEREINECLRYLSRAELRDTELLPLFGRLSLAAQHRVFQPQAKRRIVLSTNVAETSLTVPRIRYVIDGGTARISRYALRSKIQRLPIEPISQASAQQRAGRCGRLSAGVCIRLYSEEDFAQRPAFTEPEILRTHLASIILQMLLLKLGDVAAFPFIDAPDTRQINDGYRLLYELQAVDAQHQLTPLGRKMAQFPLDPRFSRMIFAAEESACLQEVLTVVAFFSLQDPRERPLAQEALAEQRQAVFVDAQSDIQSILNLFYAYQKQKHELGSNALRRWCQHYFLNPLRMKEWRELAHQLIREARQQKLKFNELKIEWIEDKVECSKGSVAFKNTQLHLIHEALLTGLLDQIGLWDERQQSYLSTRNKRFRIAPNSSLHKKRVSQVMAGSLLETHTMFARYLAPIDFSSVERLAKHLCKYQLKNPHWSKKMGNVMAEETVLLYGLPLMAGRKKPFADEDAVLAHQIFIEEALLTGEIHTRFKVIEDNLKLIAELERLEDKSRSRSMIDHQKISDFYQQRLPNHIHSVVGLEQWLKKVGENALKMKESDILFSEADTNLDGYPEYFSCRGQRWALEYAFNPGHQADGVTLCLPLTALNHVQEQDLERLVPAMLYPKVEALLRRLPKLYRRQLVPIPETAQLIFACVAASEEALLPALSQALWQHKKIKIPLEAWTCEALEAHHLMNIRLMDGKKIITESRDLSALKAEFGAQAAAVFHSRSHHQQRWFDPEQAVESWTWDNIPISERLPNQMLAYPALTPVGEALFWRYHEREEEAEAAHRLGILGLLRKHLNQEIKYLRKNLSALSSRQLQYHQLCATKLHYFDDLIDAALLSLALQERLPRSQSAWNETLTLVKQQLVAQVHRYHQQCADILQGACAVQSSLQSIKYEGSRDDLKNQLKSLIYPGFISTTEAKRWGDLRRYVQAMQRRVEKIKQDPIRDARALEALQPWQKALEIRQEALWRDYFWLLQEYRVQLFAQELGTAQKVSPQRLEALLQHIKAN